MGNKMEMSEYQQLFLSEAEELVDSLNRVLVELENDPDKLSLLNELFRYSHTLKSMAQAMGYDDMAKLTHSMETALSLLRSGQLKLQRDTVDLFFKSMDVLKRLIQGVKKKKPEKIDVSLLISRFEGIVSDISESKEKNRVEADEAIPATASEPQAVRVPLTRLDSLMDISGELAINNSRLLNISQGIDNKNLKDTVAQVSRLVSQLQDQVMQIRLVPLEYIFAPYPRMVRDMAASEDKEVELIIEGSHIGLDRTIQEEINEPLLHLLKNAVIHGIEKPQQRESLKKPIKGRIRIEAKRERDYVIIEVSDDGAGIDIEEIKKIAVQKGIIPEEELSVLGPKEILLLTTSPGYSGAKRVTETAGMGVGLNVVRTKVESFGGTLSIETRVHEGTTCIIKLPVTMAMIQVILVEVADETYCIPLSLIDRTIKVASDEIKTIEHEQVIIYQDTVLPLIGLRQRFGFPLQKRQAIVDSIHIVVVDTGDKMVGLIVDCFSGQQEIVIKPLTGVLKKLKGVSGATILGKGRVAFIVDVGVVVSDPVRQV